ncbi:MAG: bifunctional UDP-N-acetylglucosamine pyrophosphorylase / glucosamine-phosphate N-acetyltransferase [Solirubrobacteraceae bacterium]|jgi:bifunctional UDP-N-acetylglucosamine pyrophosphorylase/glucosamine-1-phosphate N-acetyltransferase|nr:bifunctional UDP-N-acetylglucosamine pyrophosphorylase / glucosamine-phosphate N-acetyltransferase [Solirubrobacteraceae bacterium]
MPVLNATVVILAAGEGTRMRSATPKVLHDLCGQPMISWPVQAALAAGAERVVVVGGPDNRLAEALPEGVAIAVQQEPRGTGDAVRAAAAEIERDAPVIVLSGDVPLITDELIAQLAAAHEAVPAAATVVTMELEDPSGYGRVVRRPDGSVERVVETKSAGDATDDDLAIREVNAGVYAFDGGELLDALEQVTTDNAQGEYYLPDVLKVLDAAEHRVAAFRVDDHTLTLGVNDRVDLAQVRAVAQRRINEVHMRAGVTIVDPAATLIDAGVELGRDTIVEPACFLRGVARAGERCRIGPLTTLIDSSLGDDVTVLHSYLESCEVKAGARIGPFAYLRPGAVLREGAKAGTFVELKNADVGAGAKVPHLSYIGDADVGEGSNIGAGTITANYDGENKHRTTIGRNVHGGVDVALVAPVTVGDDAWTGAGSVITDDVPPGALAIGRAQQRNVEDYDARKKRK